MAWEWSHTDGAYRNAQANLELLDQRTLCIIYAEWKACGKDEHGNWDGNIFNQVTYHKHFKEAECELQLETIMQYIWDRMNELRTCTNGGQYAYACPSGCHTVSFDGQFN